MVPLASFSFLSFLAWIFGKEEMFTTEVYFTSSSGLKRGDWGNDERDG